MKTIPHFGMHRRRIEYSPGVPSPRHKRSTLKTLARRRLRQWMRRHGMTQAELSRAAGERPQDVSRFFSGEMVYPPLNFLQALARVFHRTIIDLLRHPAPPAPTLQRDDLHDLALLRQTPPAVRRAVRELLRHLTRHDRAYRGKGRTGT